MTGSATNPCCGRRGMDCFASLAVTSRVETQLNPPATRCARVVQDHSPKKRAQGKPGARCTRSLACELKKHTSIVTTGSPVWSGLPCAMVLTVSFVLSPVTGFSCHRPAPNVRDDRDTPLLRARDGGKEPAMRWNWKQNIFARETGRPKSD